MIKRTSLPLKNLYLFTFFIFLTLDSKFNIPGNTILRWILPFVIIVNVFIIQNTLYFPKNYHILILCLLLIFSSIYSIDAITTILRFSSFLLIILMYYNYFILLKKNKFLCLVLYKIGFFFIAYEILNFIFLGSGQRLSGITGNPNSLGLWSNIAFVFAFFYYIKEKDKFRKIFFGLIMVISFYTALSSGSRTYFICMCINMAIAFYIIFSKKQKICILSFSIIFILLFYKNIYKSILIIPAVHRLMIEGTTRSSIWLEGLNLLHQKPFFGWGYGISQKLNSIQYIGIISGYNDYGFAWHNSYLSILIELGYIGIIPIMLTILNAIYKCLKFVNSQVEVKLVLLLIINMLICFYGGSSMMSTGSTEGFFFWGLIIWIYVYNSNLKLEREINND